MNNQTSKPDTHQAQQPERTAKTSWLGATFDFLAEPTFNMIDPAWLALTVFALMDQEWVAAIVFAIVGNIVSYASKRGSRRWGRDVAR